MDINLYNSALLVLKTLTQKKHEAYFIGGSSRNEIHNMLHKDDLPIKDYDIVTNASYKEVANVFGKVEERGEAFLVAVVKIGRYEFEVAQYRTETYPEGGSTRPSSVVAVKSLKEDVLRRDFTINSIAINENGEMIDLVNGYEDIKNKLIRAIGNPQERFSEDPLRMIRAFRFVGQLGYDIEQETFKAIKDNINLLSTIPHDRIKEEINKLLKGKYAGKAIKALKLIGRDISYSNTITGNRPFIFKRLFSLSRTKFESTLTKLDSVNKGELSLSQIYAILYRDVKYEEAINEINHMNALNSSQTREFSIYVRNHDLPFYQSRFNLLNLSRDIDIYGNGNRDTLDKVLDFYSELYNVSFKSLKPILKQPLLKKELSFNGNDVLNAGKEIGLNEPGSWVSEVIELARTRSAMGEDYRLNTVLDLIHHKLKN